MTDRPQELFGLFYLYGRPRRGRLRLYKNYDTKYEKAKEIF